MLHVGNPIKRKLCAKFPDIDKSSSGKLPVGKWPHILPCHMLSSSVGWKWEVGNGKCLQLGLLVGNATPYPLSTGNCRGPKCQLEIHQSNTPQMEREGCRELCVFTAKLIGYIFPLSRHNWETGNGKLKSRPLSLRGGEGEAREAGRVHGRPGICPPSSPYDLAISPP